MCFPVVHAEEVNSRDNIFQISDWQGYDLTTSLNDGTSLHSYIAESANEPVENSSQAEHNSIMRFTFLPRFQCSPLIEIVGSLAEDTKADERIATLRKFNNIALTIDDEEFQFPVLVEERENQIHSFFSASLQRRTSFRILVELGNRSELTFGDGSKTRFSLEGSRDTITQSLGRCRNHQ